MELPVLITLIPSDKQTNKQRNKNIDSQNFCCKGTGRYNCSKK